MGPLYCFPAMQPETVIVYFPTYYIMLLKQIVSVRMTYSTPSCEAVDFDCLDLLCQSPGVNNEEFGGFEPYDPWS